LRSDFGDLVILKIAAKISTYFLSSLDTGAEISFINLHLLLRLYELLKSVIETGGKLVIKQSTFGIYWKINYSITNI
jgi:hypothetical protein